jgi:hypothetical protein
MSRSIADMPENFQQMGFDFEHLAHVIWSSEQCKCIEQTIEPVFVYVSSLLQLLSVGCVQTNISTESSCYR